MTATDPFSLATPYRTDTCGDLRATDVGREAHLAGWVHRRRDHGHLIFLDLRDRHGITQVVIDATESPDAHAAASRVRNEFVVTAAGIVAARLPGTENAKLPTGAIELRAAELEILSRVEDAAVLRQRPGRADRREPAPQIPLPRHPPRADGAPPAAPLAARPGDPRGTPPRRIRRGRDADPHQVDARGRARLHRPVATAARQHLRPAAEPAAAQADPHGRRASTATSRSRAASATRTCAATGSPSSRSSTSR